MYVTARLGLQALLLLLLLWSFVYYDAGFISYVTVTVYIQN